MKQTEETKERNRKVYAPRGERQQKTICFRLDNENASWLNNQANKGRYINNLIAADRQQHTAAGQDDE